MELTAVIQVPLFYRLRSAYTGKEISNRSDALAVILFDRFSKTKEMVQQIDRERERERERVLCVCVCVCVCVCARVCVCV